MKDFVFRGIRRRLIENETHSFMPDGFLERKYLT